MQDFFTVISNFGFPVAVASYLLFRFEKKIEKMEKTNSKMVDSNARLTNRVDLVIKMLKRKK